MVSVKVFPFLVNLVTVSALIDMLMQDNICFALIEFRASLRQETRCGGNDVRIVDVSYSVRL